MSDIQKWICPRCTHGWESETFEGCPVCDAGAIRKPDPTGGPAFPFVEPAEVCSVSTGMILRDYFAAKAMQAIFAGPGATMVAECDGRYDETNWSAIVALNAYEMADAMLAARAGKEGA